MAVECSRYDQAVYRGALRIRVNDKATGGAAQRLAEAGIVVEEDHPDLSEAHQRQVLRAYDSAIGKAHLLREIARTSSSGRLER